MIQLGVKWRPESVEPVMLGAALPRMRAMVCVENHFKAVTVHPSAFVPRRDLWQLMRRVEDVAAPDVRMLAVVQIHAGIRRALYSDAVSVRQVQPLADPSSEVFIGGLAEGPVEIRVIQRRNGPDEMSAQRRDLVAGEIRPCTVSGNTDLREKTVAMQVTRGMCFRRET